MDLHHSSCKAKIFLMGEYCALAGGPSLVQILPHTFELKKETKPVRLPHPDSPAGLLKSWIEKSKGRPVHYSWNDPFQDFGGCGGSTAEFICLLKAYCPEIFSPKEAWSTYLEFHSQKKVKPSGADFIAQWVGYSSFVKTRPIFEITPLPEPGFSNSSFILLATSNLDRKTKTHEHLDDQRVLKTIENPLWIKNLGTIVENSFKFFKENDSLSFGKNLTDFAATLHSAGLENELSRKNRKELCRFDFVTGAKGCGASLSDVIYVQLVDQDAKTKMRPAIQDYCQKEGLRILS